MFRLKRDAFIEKSWGRRSCWFSGASRNRWMRPVLLIWSSGLCLYLKSLVK